MIHEVDFHFTEYKTRQQARRIVVARFLKEKPGLGGGNLTSRYRYNVECLSDGRRIYLIRPAVLKKGFDFVINVEGAVFSNEKENPTHSDILDDLRGKRSEDPQQCSSLHEALTRVYECEDPSHVLPEYSHLHFRTGHTVEMLATVLKWLWIEQDIRDWNYSGRLMLKRAIDGILEE